jgi:hypothetical protein
MSKKAKDGVDLRAPNPTKRKLFGRSWGKMIYNDHVGVMVTIKKDQSIKRNLEKKNK